MPGTTRVTSATARARADAARIVSERDAGRSRVDLATEYGVSESLITYIEREFVSADQVRAVVCGRCGSDDIAVFDSRFSSAYGGAIRRRRKCGSCDYRWTTFEVSEGSALNVLRDLDSENIIDAAIEKIKARVSPVISDAVGEALVEALSDD